MYIVEMMLYASRAAAPPALLRLYYGSIKALLRLQLVLQEVQFSAAEVQRRWSSRLQRGLVSDARGLVQCCRGLAEVEQPPIVGRAHIQQEHTYWYCGTCFTCFFWYKSTNTVGRAHIYSIYTYTRADIQEDIYIAGRQILYRGYGDTYIGTNTHLGVGHIYRKTHTYIQDTYSMRTHIQWYIV